MQLCFLTHPPTLPTLTFFFAVCVCMCVCFVVGEGLQTTEGTQKEDSCAKRPGQKGGHENS